MFQAEIKQDPIIQADAAKVEQNEEAYDPHYNQERLSYTKWVLIFGIVVAILAIAQIALSALHLQIHKLGFAIVLIVVAVFILIQAILSIVWANKVKNADKENTSLFQPKVNDNLSKVIFIGGLFLAGAAVICFVNIFAQRRHSIDYVVAQNSNDDYWNKVYAGKTEENLINFLKNIAIAQGVFAIVFFFYFLLAARAAFRVMKWSNEAMSYIVFLGTTLLFAFSLGIIYYANYSFGYGDYPQLRAHFPVWNIRGLFIVAISLTVAAVLAFLIDHRGWRVGFFVLSFLLLILLVLLVNFTGYAFRHTRQTYEYYKGVPSESTCINRIGIVNATELESFGCPTKYLPAHNCTYQESVWWWEDAEKAHSSTYYCLNTQCCGLLGQLYTQDYTVLANFGLLAVVAGCFVSIGAYYYWYVSYANTTRNKNKDYIWLGLIAVLAIAYVIVFFTVDKHYITEQLGTNGVHL